MTDDEIQELILVFLQKRGGYIAGASERELFTMVKIAVDAAERAAFENERGRIIAELESLGVDYYTPCDIVRLIRALISTEPTPP